MKNVAVVFLPGGCSDPRGRSPRVSDLLEPPRRWIRTPTRSSPLSPCFPSLPRSVLPPPEQTLARAPPCFAAPLPELRAAIDESLLREAAPRPPLRPRQAVQAGTPSSSRHHQFTESTPTAVRRRFLRLRRASDLADLSICFTVSRRTRPTLSPLSPCPVSSARSSFVARRRVSSPPSPLPWTSSSPTTFR